jgi:hypothetical protein
MIPILNPLINLFIVSLMIWVPAFAGMSGSWG